MVLYAVFMASVSLLFFCLGLAIYMGKTDLIHDYHQTDIPEEKKRDYGKAFSKGMFSLSLSFFLSGVLSLFDTNAFLMKLSLVVLYGGIILSLILIFQVQKKYNGGLF